MEKMQLNIIDKTLPNISKQHIIQYYISFSNSYNKYQNKFISKIILNKSPPGIRRMHPLIQQKMQMIFTANK